MCVGRTPEAAVAALKRIGPRTVVWLSETQEYLGALGDGGERGAAKLRSLLTDPSRGPVLVLGTLWREQRADFTLRSGPLVAQILDGTVSPVEMIELPEAFTDIDLEELKRVAAGDARLEAAVAHADNGHITQYLAGAPDLLARFAAAPSAAKAVIYAAMDARRLGHRFALPLTLLEAAAPAYLTDAQWHQIGEDWLEQALAYTPGLSRRDANAGDGREAKQMDDEFPQVPEFEQALRTAHRALERILWSGVTVAPEEENHITEVISQFAFVIHEAEMAVAAQNGPRVAWRQARRDSNDWSQ